MGVSPQRRFCSSFYSKFVMSLLPTYLGHFLIRSLQKMIVVHHSPIIRDLIPKVYKIYCGLVGALNRAKDRLFRSSSKILNNYDRPLVRRLGSLPEFQLSMMNRRYAILPLQTCGPLVYPKITCRLWTTIYVSSFLVCNSYLIFAYLLKSGWPYTRLG